MIAAANSAVTSRLLQRALDNDPRAWPELFARHAERLRKMVRLRLDRRLRGRLDSAAVLQLVYQDVCRRLREYAGGAPKPFFLWLRGVAGQRLAELHRQHLGGAAPEGEALSLYRGAMPAVHPVSLAAQLLGNRGGSRAAARADLLLRLEQALNGMDPLDRELLALCHFEELSNAEAAAVLGVDPAAASHRYVEALRRLKEILAAIPGFFDRPAANG
jgi:RNA polymerase sigma-70 factor (ECF subfamily)